MANKIARPALFRGLTPYQLEVLGHIAVGCDLGHYPKTLAILEQRGLLVSGSETLPGPLPVTVKRYEMPIVVHMAWCEWCSERVQAGEIPDGE